MADRKLSDPAFGDATTFDNDDYVYGVVDGDTARITKAILLAGMQVAPLAAGNNRIPYYNAAGALTTEAGFEYDAATNTLSAGALTMAGNISLPTANAGIYQFVAGGAYEMSLGSANPGNDSFGHIYLGGNNVALGFARLQAGNASAQWMFELNSSGGLTLKEDAGSTLKVWHQGNDGAGSLLDADLLDGQQGAYYAAASDLALKADLVGGKVPTAQLPAITIGETFSVASQAAMLALAAQIGDVAIRTDLSNRKYLLLGTAATVADWVAMDASGLPVDSVNGYEGVVVLAKADVGLGSADNTSDVNKPVSNATQTALNAKQPLHVTLTELAQTNWAANAIPYGLEADDVGMLALGANTFPARSSSGDLAAAAITDAALLVLAGGDVAIADGGTGQGTAQAAINALSAVAAATAGWVLTKVGNDAVWAAAAGGMAIGGTVTGATVGSILFAGAASALAQDAGLFWNNATKRFGINTAGAPGFTFDVFAGDGRLYFDQELFTQRSGNNFYNAPGINFKRTRGTIAAPTAPIADDYLGDFFWRIQDNTVVGKFGLEVDSAGTGTIMKFSPCTLAGAQTDAIIALSSGNVGFGTTETQIAARVHAVATTEQLRLGYDASNYFSATVSSTGGVTLNAVGTGARFSFSDTLNIPTATPATAAATGTAGDVAWDVNYIYVATAANTWKRAALATW